MQTITATDTKTGEQFQFSYDPETKTYQINDIYVVRKRYREIKEDAYVFGSITAALPKFYHVARKQFEQLMATPDLPQN